MSNQFTIGKRTNKKNIESLDLTQNFFFFKALTWNSTTLDFDRQGGGVLFFYNLHLNKFWEDKIVLIL